MAERLLRNWGLSSSQSGTQNLANLGLGRTGRWLVTGLLEWFAFQWVLQRGFGVHEFGERAPELRVFFAVGFEPLQVGLKAALFAVLTTEIGLNRLNEKLINRPPFDFAEDLQGSAFFGINAKGENGACTAWHTSMLREKGCDVNIAF